MFIYLIFICTFCISLGQKLDVCYKEDGTCEDSQSVESSTFVDRDWTNEELELMKQPTFVDDWGYSHNWTDPKDGWTAKRRMWVMKNQRSMIQKLATIKTFTKAGYKVMDIPKALYSTILDNLDHTKMYAEVEENVYGSINSLTIINGSEMNANRTAMIPLLNLDSVRGMVHKHLQPVMEKWTKLRLHIEQVVVYGVRRYFKGASLLLHCDRAPSHVISAVLQIDQKVHSPWPFILINHSGKKKKIHLQPGEMLLYESCTIRHGRQFPLDGDYYDNLFVHLTPRNGQIYK